jgi:hypothetical protein
MMARILIALAAAFLALGATVPEETSQPPMELSETCSCPAASACGKTAASCRASCSGYRIASCDCVDPNVVICSAYGPYGLFKNVCRCL